MFFVVQNNSSQVSLILKQMNIEITLPDGTIKEYNSPVTGFQVAQDIGSRLAKDAVCVEINK